MSDIKNNTLDLDDECSDSEEMMIKTTIKTKQKNIVNYNDDSDDSNDEDVLYEDNIDDEMILLELTLTRDDFDLLQKQGLIINDDMEPDNVSLILNNLFNSNKNYLNDKFISLIFISGIILGIIMCKYLNK